MRRELPARPNIEHLKTQAKDLLEAAQRKETGALARFRESLPSARGLDDARLAATSFALHDAQSVIAREYGFASFAELRAHVESLQGASPEALRTLMAAHPNAPLPQQVIEALGAAAASKPAPAPIGGATLLPMLPLRGAMLTPGAVAPISVGRPSSLAAVDAAQRNGALVAAFSQKDAASEAPAHGDLHGVGCIAQILTTVPGGDLGTYLVLRGTQWVALDAIERSEPYLAARVVPFEVHAGDAAEVERLAAALREKVRTFAARLPGGERIVATVEKMSALELADATVANLPCSVGDKAAYANESGAVARLERALALVEGRR
jgi:Lon protease-like protein